MKQTLIRGPSECLKRSASTYKTSRHIKRKRRRSILTGRRRFRPEQQSPRSSRNGQADSEVAIDLQVSQSRFKLSDLPPELIYKIHVYALNPALAETNRLLYSTLQAAPTIVRAEWIESLYRVKVGVDDRFRELKNPRNRTSFIWRGALACRCLDLGTLKYLHNRHKFPRFIRRYEGPFGSKGVASLTFWEGSFCTATIVRLECIERSFPIFVPPWSIQMLRTKTGDQKYKDYHELVIFLLSNGWEIPLDDLCRAMQDNDEKLMTLFLTRPEWCRTTLQNHRSPFEYAIVTRNPACFKRMVSHVKELFTKTQFSQHAQDLFMPHRTSAIDCEDTQNQFSQYVQDVLTPLMTKAIDCKEWEIVTFLRKDLGIVPRISDIALLEAASRAGSTKSEA